MSSSTTHLVRLPATCGVVELLLTDKLARELEAVIRAYRRPPGRDYAAEIERYLQEAGVAHTTQIARAIHARDQIVREILAHDARFQRASAPRGASGRPIYWTLAPSPPEPVPKLGTTSDTAGSK
ncbi:MAG: hypothetical protein U0R50_13510 [Gaiellales bacterium]